jgi:putative membrane protein
MTDDTPNPESSTNGEPDVTPLPGWTKSVLRPERVQMVEEAVAAAEKKTSGEIVPMIVRRSSTVGHVPLLLMSVFVALFMVVDGPGLQYVWLGEHWAWYLLDAVVLLILSNGLSQLPMVQRWLTTQADEIEQVEMRAELEFYESGMHTTQGATGILLFVSLMERRAVVLADRAIDERVPPGTWDEVCRTMVQGIKEKHVGLGLVAAIEKCGDILAEEFPIADDDENELRNSRVIKE